MKKKITIGLIIILIIIIGLAGTIYYLQQKEKNSQQSKAGETNQTEETNEIDEEITWDISDVFYKMSDLVWSNEFFGIEDKINEYYKNISNNQKSEVLKVLETQYISDNKITEDNVLDKIKFKNNFNTFTINEIYVLDNDMSENAKITYYIDGYIWSDNYSKKTETYIIMEQLCMDDSYKILPQDETNLTQKSFDDIINEKTSELQNNWSEFEKQYNEYLYENIDSYEENSDDENVVEENEIAESEIDEKYTLTFENISAEDLAKRYINHFRINALFNTEDSYKYANTSNENFSDMEKYKQYIEENRNNLLKMEIENIKNLTDNTDYSSATYEITDKNGTKYTITLKEIMQYTINIE